MSTKGIQKASGIISLFNEDDMELKVRALRLLSSNIDNIWAEVTHLINEMYTQPHLFLP